ncbi:MAG: hypothetical protein U0531_01865 [Dehalococcoidia bacterium]
MLFFPGAVEAQGGVARLRAARPQLQDRYRDLTRTKSKSAILAVDLVMEQVYVTVAQVEAHTKATYPTARKAIDTLVALGILEPYPRATGPQVWVARELLREVYER